MSQPLLIEHDDGVDRVTLNRPDNLNALDPALIDALNACVYQAITTRIRRGPEYETKKGFGDAV